MDENCDFNRPFSTQAMSPETLGVGPGFSIWLWLLSRKLGKPVVLIAHELNYPVSLSLKGILLGIPHFFQTLALTWICDQIFCSTEHFCKKLRHRSKWLPFSSEKISWAPIASNISVRPESVNPEFIKEFRRKNGIHEDETLLFHFGGKHPTHLYHFVFESYARAREIFGKAKVRLVCVGVTPDQFQESDSPFLNEIIFKGFLSEKEVSAWFLASDLVLAPFMDGISTRRSTTMAAFAHGRPVLTTVGYGSLGKVPWSSFCVTTHTERKEEFIEKVIEAIRTRPPLGEKGEAYYFQTFDWPVIAKSLISWSQGKANTNLTLTRPLGETKSVLHIYSGNLYGGIEKVLSTLAEFQKKEPGTQHHFALCFKGRLSEELLRSNANVYFLNGVSADAPVSVRWSRPWTLRQARKNLKTLLEAKQFEAVICHAPWSYAIFGDTVRKADIPLFFWAHDGFRGKDWLERLSLRIKPNKIICNSGYTEKTIRPFFKDVSTSVIYCPVPPPSTSSDADSSRAAVRAKLGLSENDFVILQVSRMEPWKGHLLLLEALGKLTSLQNWRVLIVGGAQRKKEVHYLNDLKSLCTRLDLDRRVEFLGDRKDVYDLMQASDLFVQPNLSPEPFGITFIEAMYSGLPIITLGYGGPSETVSQNIGILLAEPKSDLLANALSRFLSLDRNQRMQYQKVGPKRAFEISDPQNQIKKLNSLI
ncbi:MAG: glycosyltransferase family 4 protein [Bdellovibrio sp.]|nr:glycosyltransferase family 4 protein [Bdellovibrio sp.]